MKINLLLPTKPQFVNCARWREPALAHLALIDGDLVDDFRLGFLKQRSDLRWLLSCEVLDRGVSGLWDDMPLNGDSCQEDRSENAGGLHVWLMGDEERMGVRQRGNWSAATFSLWVKKGEGVIINTTGGGKI